MSLPKEILSKNRLWSEQLRQADPDFFLKLSKQQNPEYLWIGCADSRVPATQILDLMPGQVFVHRNIANIVDPSDLNCLSVIQYAIEILKVKHIIVCGHYGCGGVRASMDNRKYGLLDNWLMKIRDVYYIYQDKIDSLQYEIEKENLLCELNVIEQVKNMCNTEFVINAWNANQDLSVHGLIYNINDGILKDLDVSKVDN